MKMNNSQLISLRICIGLWCYCYSYLALVAATAKGPEQRFSAAVAPKKLPQPFNVLLVVHDASAGRRKRQADDYDENADVIPDWQQPTEQRFEEPAGGFVAQIAEGFGQMWQSLVDMVKFCLDAIGQIFGSDDADSNDGRNLDYVRHNELPPENNESRPR